MLEVYLGQCAPNAAYMAVSSLNDLIEIVDAADLSETEVIETLPHPTANVLAEVMQQEGASLMRRFVSQLQPRMADITYRHYWLGHTQSEIADDLGITRSAVSQSLARVHRLGRAFVGFSEH